MKILLKIFIVIEIFFSITYASSKVDIIKNGLIEDYSSDITIGEALNIWSKKTNCKDAKWLESKNERQESIVSFSCFANKEDVIDVKQETDFAYRQYTGRIKDTIQRDEKWLEEQYKNNQAGQEALKARIRENQKKLEKQVVEFEEWKKAYMEVMNNLDKVEFLFRFAVFEDPKGFHERFIGKVYHMKDLTIREDDDLFLLYNVYKIALNKISKK